MSTSGRLVATGVAEGRIALVRDGSPVSFTDSDAVEPRPADLANSCVLLYSGNYGVAHEVDTVVEGYARHHREGTARVRLWLSATGSGADEVARRLAAQGVPFHRSLPVPLERLAGLLSLGCAPGDAEERLRELHPRRSMPASNRGGRCCSWALESDVDLLARAAVEVLARAVRRCRGRPMCLNELRGAQNEETAGAGPRTTK